MKRSLSLVLTVFLLSTTIAQVPVPVPQQVQQTALTNRDIVSLIESGLSADVVVAKIRNSRTNFDTNPEALAELRKANVPDSVILAMVNAINVGEAPPAEAKKATVSVPDGTEVEIQLVNTASGEELKVGSTVDFTVNRDVVVDGVTVFLRDAPARAKITTAKKAGRWGRAGKLEWAMQDIQSADGARVPARFTKRLTGDSKGGTVAVAAVATTVLLGPLGLLWGLKKGKPAIIPSGNRYSVFVHGDTKISGKPLAPPSQ